MGLAKISNNPNHHMEHLFIVWLKHWKNKICTSTSPWRRWDITCYGPCSETAGHSTGLFPESERIPHTAIGSAIINIIYLAKNLVAVSFLSNDRNRYRNGLSRHFLCAGPYGNGVTAKARGLKIEINIVDDIF